MPIKIFVGSSTAAKRQATMFMQHYQNTPGISFFPWWEQFTAGRSLLGELNRIRETVDAALLFITPESQTINSKGDEVIIPNLNVMFEFGYFYSTLGQEKVAIIKYSTVDLPSDLSGYVHINGSNYFQKQHGVSIGKKTEKDFKRWIDAMHVEP